MVHFICPVCYFKTQKQRNKTDRTSLWILVVRNKTSIWVYKKCWTMIVAIAKVATYLLFFLFLVAEPWFNIKVDKKYL